MALDGIFLSLLKKETENQILNSRIEKIHQPSRDELVFSFRTKNGAKKLFLSARADGARVHITNILPENPEKPPMFCLLLRKRLSGARLVEIRQQSLERIVEFVFNATDELGDEVVYSLFVEIMSRRSNIILVKDGVIVDSIKRIDESKSSVRQILPGEKYCFPPKQDKYNIFDCDLSELNNKIHGSEKTLSKSAMENIMGISPVISREFESGLTSEKLLFYAKNPKPYILFENDRAFDFTFMPISQYGGLAVQKEYSSFGELLDFYYFERERRERTKQKAHDLYTTVSNLCERSRRKIFNRQKELEACADKEKFRMYGDLISANMYVLKKGSLFYTVNDFYTGEEVKITADPSLTPSQNAQKYYKEYRKKQVAEQKLTGFIELAEEECAYLETVLDEIERAQSSSDIAEIKKELAEMGYLKKRLAKNKNSKPLPPYEYVSDDGFEIFAGRNNIQNDKLTLKESRKNDMWFHSKDFPGSHIIVKTDGKELSEKTIIQAAQIAAFHSKESNSSNVAIDFTVVKNVKKPSGAKPGKVIYTDYKTVYVTPSVEIAERLIKK